MDKTKKIPAGSNLASSQDGRRYVLWGSAGHAKVLASLISLTGGRVIALFDNCEVPTAIEGVPLYLGETGFARWADGRQDLDQLIGLAAIGGARGRDRLAIQALFQRHGLALQSLIHPQASVCASAKIGFGTQVLAQALVAAEAQVGQACIINHCASVDHECVLGDGVHLAPGAILCGCVTLGDNVMIGAGAVVLPRVVIGADSIIGAGAIVTRNVQPGVIVMGNPARVVRKNS